MPKKKPREDNEFLDRPKSRKRQRRSFWGGLLYFLWLPPMRYTILLALVGLLVWWQWPELTGLFSWGLLFIAAAIITFIVQMKRRKLPSFILRFNRWLGAVAFVLAAWGILAIFDMGGEFGSALIMEPAPVVDVLIVIGLFIAGVILVAPKVCLKLVVRFLSWLGGQFQRQPAKVPGYLEKQLANERAAAPAHIELHPKSPVEEKPPMPREMEEPVVRPERAIPKSPLMAPPEREEVTRSSALAPTTQELRQVAQEVWKKYGQSSDLVMVDGWKLPPIDILDTTPEIEFSEADNVQRAKIIEDALASYGVEAKVVQINAGPTVTQFGMEPGWDRKLKEKKERDRNGDVRVTLEEVSKTRVKVERITSLALALAAPSIRIEAPVPGKSIVGIEVPNTSIGVVSLRSVIESST
jgi:S-DNA-T family DNA segregation ATPase FtsK/SpoIIIE